MQDTQVWSLGQENLLEKEMATHCSILVWKIPWTEEPSGLHSMESQELDSTWQEHVISLHRQTLIINIFETWDGRACS